MKDHSYGNDTFETYFFTLSNAYYIYSYTINVSNTAYHANKDQKSYELRKAMK